MEAATQINEILLAELRPRQRRYLEGLAEGKSKRQAALDAGYAPSVARTPGEHIETEEVREILRRLIDA